MQFNETDLAFATRLMEQEGYFYFFEHGAAGHKLIIANQASAFKDIPGAAMHLGGDIDATLVTDWSRPAHTARGKMKLKDYDPEQPDTLLQAEKTHHAEDRRHPQREDFRWPANTFHSGTVADRSQWEMEAAEAQASLFEGASRFGRLVPGGKFTLVAAPRAPMTAPTSCAPSAITRPTTPGCRRAAQPPTPTISPAFSPPCPGVSQWPRRARAWRAIHTALVLGPQHNAGDAIKSQDGEEIYTDKLGRVKVRFYWDHRAEATGGQSVWARVIQPWAGKGWGAQFIPRVGTEVAVAFVDGDPDRPIVIGGLYNGRDTPIYSAGEKTKSGFRSRST